MTFYELEGECRHEKRFICFNDDEIQSNFNLVSNNSKSGLRSVETQSARWKYDEIENSLSTY
jgi:hypothetical protein